MTPVFEVARTPLDRGTTLIEASAGTGKTYAIAGLFLRLVLEEGLGVGQILVTTYTVPATAELRDRIRQLLRQASVDWPCGRSAHPLIQTLIDARRIAPELARRRLDAALHAFDEAAIQTIHGVCQRILQDRAFESGLPFDTELITDQAALLRELAEDYWRSHVYESPPELVAAALQSGLDPDSLARLLGRTTPHAVLDIRPDSSIATVRAEVEAGFAEFRQSWPGWRDEIRALFESAEWAKGDSAKPELTGPRLEAIDQLSREPAAPLPAHEALEAFTSEQIAADTRARRSTPAHPFFDLCSRMVRARKRFAVATQVEFLTWARAELPRRKLQRNVVSFDDLLTQLHRALTSPGGPRLAGLVRQRFRAALIDEFQDTDPVQNAIFREIFTGGDHWLFLIGDPKQAIYGFRGADVFSYLAAAERADHPFRLGTNHRSASELVDAVNAIFGRSSRPFVVDRIAFDPVAATQDSALFRCQDATRPPFRVWMPGPDEPLTATDAHRRLPRIVAAEVARMLAGGCTISNKPFAPSDVAVLTATNQQAQTVQDAFTALGIPSVLLSNGNVFQSPEAAELQILLAAIAEPARDGLIRGALATPFLALTAAEIAAVNEDERAWESWLMRFQHWNARWRDPGFIQMFRPLLLECGVRARLLGAPGGERALTNLLHLAELLHCAATEQRLAPAALLQWLGAQRRDTAVTPEEHEVRLERDEDAAKIITVHKSKGLEFNVVICPFAWGKAEWRAGDPPRFHEAGAGEALVLDLGPDENNASREAANRELLAEHARLLYVALTRAKHECHLVWGRFKGSESSAAMWVLHPPPPPLDDPVAALAAHSETMTAPAIEAEMKALARSKPEAIEIVPMPAEDASPFRPAHAESPGTRARHFEGRIDRSWRVSSFSSLTEHHETELPDYDRAPAAGEAAEPGIEPAGIHAFPAGKTAGVCLHTILEKLDFTKPETIGPLVDDQLTFFGFSAAEWSEPVADCIRKALAVPLAPTLRLGTVASAARLTELEFYFPVHRLDPASLSALLSKDTDGTLSFEPRGGMIRGFIDLVLEHEGKFFIIDWKSNRLGAAAETYRESALRDAMLRHHYALQYHLYTLALDRYLRLRLGRSYRYEHHFGGVFYIFLRGVDPMRPQLGVFRDRPSATRVAHFERLFSTHP